MKRVKAVQFVPLGRPPKVGEWFRYRSDERRPDEACYFICAEEDDDEPDRVEAVERREIEIEVPDPVPDWIPDAFGGRDRYQRGSLLDEHINIFSAAFRALVEERAKAAAERIAERQRTLYGTSLSSETILPMIREVFLK